MQWIVIYPMVGVIHPLNHWSQIDKLCACIWLVKLTCVKTILFEIVYYHLNSIVHLTPLVDSKKSVLVIKNR